MSDVRPFRDVKRQWLQQLSCDKDLSDSARSVALYIITTHLNGHTEKAWPSYQTIADATGKSVKTIESHRTAAMRKAGPGATPNPLIVRLADAVIDGIPVNVVIDTGAETSIGNRALQRALRQRGVMEQATLTSVTGQQIQADIAYPDKLSIGSADISRLMVAYVDSPVFSVLDLESRPAMLLGIRELRLFKRIAVDFAARRVYFDLPS